MQPRSSNWAGVEGAPLPLGATWLPAERAYNFSLFSRHATSVELLLYAPGDPAFPAYRLPLDPVRNKSRWVWHCRVPQDVAPQARYYAYLVDGPNDPGRGNRFDGQKVLLDPYATSVYFPTAFDRGAACRPGSNAGHAALGVLPLPEATPFDWGADPRPRHTSDTVFYELHVRGFTARANAPVAPGNHGTYAGVVEMIPYLQQLGVTVVELMPVNQNDPQEGSYWGYMPLSFFAPHAGYASAADVADVANEFKTMVKALHEAGIEVVLDVVYNHTTEGDAGGPTYSYRGIDNGTYYLLAPDMTHYNNDTGCGNTLRTAHPAVRKLVVDSLAYWATEMHVDGFRFDLASILTRKNDGSIDTDDPPIISEISADPVFADLRLIAEPWDPNQYELGRGFPGLIWGQWNDHFRDDVRSFVKGDQGYVNALIARLYGSDDYFPDQPPDVYHSFQSVNFLTVHDGFCLYDLVAYNGKHNEANGQGNTDGSDNNRSWNCGWEGDENAPAEVRALRERQVKNFCCLLLLANGTPLIRAGDEFLNTQRGNNNPYNQDNEISWLDWDLAARNEPILRFFREMIAFRKAHPSLARSRFWREDVRWHGVGQDVDRGADSHTLAFYLDGAAEKDDDVYVMINAYWQDLKFTVQEGVPAHWRRIVDTSLASPADFVAPDAAPALGSLQYLVRARSVVILLGV